jgi:hypothetical protein
VVLLVREHFKLALDRRAIPGAVITLLQVMELVQVSCTDSVGLFVGGGQVTSDLAILEVVSVELVLKIEPLYVGVRLLRLKASVVDGSLVDPGRSACSESLDRENLPQVVRERDRRRFCFDVYGGVLVILVSHESTSRHHVEADVTLTSQEGSSRQNDCL